MNWKINNLLVKKSAGDFNDVVVIVDWTCSFSDGDSFGSISMASYLPEPGNDSFIPYQDLSQDEIFGWIWSSGVNKSEVEASVQKQIDQSKQSAPFVGLSLPWN